MKLLFLTDNFPPEVNAPATRTYEHCREWVKKGIEVTVITCVPNFPEGKVFKGYKNKLYQKEYIDGIKVIRVWTYVSANKGFIKRTLDYISFMLTSFIAGILVKTDIIVATSPQFFTAVSGRWLSFWKRKPWVMEVRDLWPDSIKAVGVMKTSTIITFLKFLEKRMYKTASKIIVVTDSFKEQIVNNHNISLSKIKVVKNGVNLELFQPQEKDKELLKSLELENKTVIGYVGTHGMAHGLDFVLKCANEVTNPNIHFLFVGSGAKKDELLALKESLKLKNVSMVGMVSKKEVKKYISITDVSLVNLRKSDTFKSVIPSKIFECVGMNKPILLGVEGESKKIVESYGVGETFEPENKEQFLQKVNEMCLYPKDYSPGFSKIANDFDRVKLAKQMIEFMRI